MIVKLDLTGNQYQRLLVAMTSPENQYIIHVNQASRQFVRLKECRADERGMYSTAHQEHHVTLEVEEMYHPMGASEIHVPLAPLINIYRAIGLFPDVPAQAAPSSQR